MASMGPHVSGAHSEAPKRTALWYVKAVFAAYACAVGSILLLFLLMMFVLGAAAAARWLFDPILGVRPLVVVAVLFWIAWAPFVWRRLR
jgi:hypothetical protein